MPDDTQYSQPEKLKLDGQRRYHIKLPNGKEKIVELTEKEQYTAENWFHLIGKHPLRAEIVNILRIYSELNISRISSLVKQSKPTVSRHLKSMKNDGLLLSRIVGKYNRGKIPPMLFSCNQKIVDVVEHCQVQPPKPDDWKEQKKFFQREIDSHRAILHRYREVFDKFDSLLDMFERNLNNKTLAKEIWDSYFDENTTNTFPSLGYFYFSKKYSKQFDDAFKSYTVNLIRLLAEENADPDVKDRDFFGIYANLPIKILYQVYKKEIIDKKS
jgi:DNA-binding transcriptional ArsR family regulator